jgi:orotate phosphoribosyltransferase
VPATILLDADTLARHVRRLAAEIEADHPDGVVLIGVLKGALLFVADLARAITRVPVELDFMAISRFAPDSGRVRILHDLDSDISGRDVVVVEDLVDASSPRSCATAGSSSATSSCSATGCTPVTCTAICPSSRWAIAPSWRPRRARMWTSCTPPPAGGTTGGRW